MTCSVALTVSIVFGTNDGTLSLTPTVTGSSSGVTNVN